MKSSRQILYFLIGVLIAFVLITESQADCYNAEESSSPPPENYQISDGTDYTGITTWTAARDAILAEAAQADCVGYVLMTNNPTGPCSGWYSYRKRAQIPPDCNYYDSSADTTYHYIPYSNCAEHQDGNCNLAADNLDLYPDDDEDYQYTVKEKIRDKDTGEVVYTLVETDRGDTFEFGDRPSDLTNYNTWLSFNPDWKDSEELYNEDWMGTNDIPIPGATPSPVGGSDIDDGIKDYVDGTPDPVADGGGPGWNGDSENPTTGDGDSDLLGKIVKNTKATDDNIQNLGKYLKSINETLGRMDKKDDLKIAGTIGEGTDTGTGSTGSGVIGGTGTSGDVQTGVEGALETSEEDQTGAVTASGNVDSEFGEAQSTIKGDASLEDDAPLDYKEKTDIVTKLDEIIGNNPVSDILSNSGVEITGSNSTIAFQWKGYDISYSMSKWSSQLQTFGTMLMAMTALSGMVMIFRGF
jgi:hypothetical protein